MKWLVRRTGGPVYIPWIILTVAAAVVLYMFEKRDAGVEELEEKLKDLEERLEQLEAGDSSNSGQWHLDIERPIIISPVASPPDPGGLSPQERWHEHLGAQWRKQQCDETSSQRWC